MIPAASPPAGRTAAMGTQLWRAIIAEATPVGYTINVPALSSGRVYRRVERLETVVDWAADLSDPAQWTHGAGDPHPVIPVIPYGAGDRVLVAFVGDSPVILGRLV
jgi:hypothetical protein